jgi:hypothetical protein
MTWEIRNDETRDGGLHGPFVGNGKIGYLVNGSLGFRTTIGVSRSMLSTPFTLDPNGSYVCNVIDAFNPATVRFAASAEDATTHLSLQDQVLDMYTGTCRSGYALEISAPKSRSIQAFQVQSELYPVRHLPYCSVQTLSVTPKQYTDALDLFHIISIPSSSPYASATEFNNNVIFNETSHRDGLYMLHGKASSSSSSQKSSLAVCSGYVFDQPDHAKMIGFNRPSGDPNSCYQKMKMTGMHANTTYTLHIVTCQMSDQDFGMATEEVKRILMNITPDVARLRQQHVRAWADAWKHNVTIDFHPTPHDSAATEANRRVALATRYALYMVWSSVRDNAHSELQPVMDATGNLFWDGDLWYLPLLIVFKPSAAKLVLDARYQLLEHATKLAAGYGYAGSKFPSNGDVVGYGTNPYWDTSSALHIFNTGLISMNIWNYYRVSSDKLWLQKRGYEMLKSNADFFCSKMEIDEDGSVHLRGVYSMNNVPQDDNTLTNYMAKIAFQTAIEASYELHIPANPDWIVGYHGLDVVIGDGIILRESAAPAEDGGGGAAILERLVPLLPLYSEVLFKTHRELDMAKMIADNIRGIAVPVNGKGCFMNSMIAAWLQGQLYTASLPANATSGKPAFEGSLESVLESAYAPPWGMFEKNGTCDVSLCAMFVLMLITTMGTVRIAGNVTETRFYTEKMGLQVSHASRMPSTWKSIKMTGVGQSRGAFMVFNSGDN